MSISYVGVDLGSSNFHQVALNHSGTATLNREFTTSEANLIKAFSDMRGETTCIWKRASWRPGPVRLSGRW